MPDSTLEKFSVGAKFRIKVPATLPIWAEIKDETTIHLWDWVKAAKKWDNRIVTIKSPLPHNMKATFDLSCDLYFSFIKETDYGIPADWLVDHISEADCQPGKKCQVILPEILPSWVSPDSGWFKQLWQSNCQIVTVRSSPFEGQWGPETENFQFTTLAEAQYSFNLEWLFPIDDYVISEPHALCFHTQPLQPADVKTGLKCRLCIPKKRPSWATSDSWFNVMLSHHGEIVTLSDDRLVPRAEHDGSYVYIKEIPGNLVYLGWLYEIIPSNQESSQNQTSPLWFDTQTKVEKMLEKVETTTALNFSLLQEELKNLRLERDKLKSLAEINQTSYLSEKTLASQASSGFDNLLLENGRLHQKLSDVIGELTLTQGHLSLMEKKLGKNKEVPEYFSKIGSWFNSLKQNSFTASKKVGSIILAPGFKLVRFLKKEWKRTDWDDVPLLILFTCLITSVLGANLAQPTLDQINRWNKEASPDYQPLIIETSFQNSEEIKKILISEEVKDAQKNNREIIVISKKSVKSKKDFK